MIKFKQLVYGWVDRKFLGGCSSYNSLETRKSCRSKKQAREAFRRNGVPHAEGQVFVNPLKAFQFVRQHGFPVVIKPNVSGFSRGSYFPITSHVDLIKALFLVKLWWPSTVIEQYLEGKNYRIVVLKNEVMSLIRRYPPFVIGDGSSTISELIDTENGIRQQMGLHPVIYPISKDSKVEKYLAKTKRSLLTIPKKNERVYLFYRVALAPGGIVETIEKEKIHPDNLELLLRIPPLFDANILGIDAIFKKGIEYSHREQDVIFLEVNSRPYLKMHDFPRYGAKEDLSTFYSLLESLEIKEKDIF